MSRAWQFFWVNSLWLAHGWRKTRAFQSALRNPRATQEARLLSLLKHNARSDYGQRYRFGRLRTIQDYQDAVPPVAYDSLEKEIEAIKRGRQGVLTEEPVISMEKTAGSTGGSKYIPYTSALKREFQAAVAPWISDLYHRRLKIMCGGSYWSISPMADQPEMTEGGLRIGCEDEREYFSALDRGLLERLILTPSELARIVDVETSRYVTLRFLLQTPELSFISVWNPSFLTLLARFLRENAAGLIADIRQGTLTPPAALPPALHAALARRLSPQPGRARELEGIWRRGQLPPAEVWPKLTLISCWGSAHARHFLPELQSLFRGVEIQPKGLLATEGVVSIPLLGHDGAALALTSHFFEFIPEGASTARPLLADEIQQRQNYTVLVTTGGGLYRYRLGDRVQVVGKIHETPLVDFVGKEGQISDVCGEKLHVTGVEMVLADALRRLEMTPSFAMLAPEWGEPPRYLLFIEAPDLPEELLDRLAASLEIALTDGHHYAYCRRLGQLGAVRAVRVRDGARRYLERCVTLGQRLGSIKPSGLHCQTGWLSWFQADCAGPAYSRDESLRV